MTVADRWVTCRIGYVETARALGLSGRPSSDLLVEFRHDWQAVSVIEVDTDLSEHAAELALEHGLRSLDAMHLAAALAADSRDLTFATWDRRLWTAAANAGLRLMPEEL